MQGHLLLEGYNLDDGEYNGARHMSYGLQGVLEALKPVNLINVETVDTVYHPKWNTNRASKYKISYVIYPDNPVTNIRINFHKHISHANPGYYIALDGSLATPGAHEIIVDINNPAAANVRDVETGSVISEFFDGPEYGIKIEFDNFNQNGDRLSYGGYETANEVCRGYMKDREIGRVQKLYLKFNPYTPPANKYVCQFHDGPVTNRIQTNSAFFGQLHGYTWNFLFKSGDKTTFHLVGNSATGGYDTRIHFGVKGGKWYIILGDRHNLQEQKLVMHL